MIAVLGSKTLTLLSAAVPPLVMILPVLLVLLDVSERLAEEKVRAGTSGGSKWPPEVGNRLVEQLRDRR